VNQSQRPRATRTILSSGLSGIAVAALVWGLLTAAGVVLPAQQASAADGSEVTVTSEDQDPDYENAPFPGLKVTVSQTRDLIDQGITVSWTGGKQSTPPTIDTGGTNFLQIFQCWGDEQGAPSRPDRTTCVYGGIHTPGSLRDGSRVPGSIAPEDAPYSVEAAAYTSIPFRAATGEVIASVVDGAIVPVDVNTNQFFTRYTSNEIPWAGSGSNGSGKVKFETQTALRSAGLGCGSPTTTGGTTAGSSCWLVIVPRGDADSGADNISASGLFWDAWKHRLAVRLDFRQVGAHCAIGAAERQLAGSELISNAVQSWQPKLCTASGGAVYSQLTGAESDAVLAASIDKSAALALTSRSLDTEGGTDPLTYAPIAVTGMAIVFAVDRQPQTGRNVPAEVIGRRNLPFTDLKLTPRLVAKLLTYSYVDALPDGADKSRIGWISALNPGHNARNLTRDPDFLAINDPEWQYQLISSPALADLLAPQGRSDAAVALWNYVLADADARAFLNGQADPWGMIVNPWFSTKPEINPTGGAFNAPSDSYPRADPIEKAQGSDGAAPVNLVSWRPYTNDYATSASLTLRGDGQILGGWNALGNPPAYEKTSRSLPGFQSVLGLTDLGAAAQYQLYTAKLLNPAGEYVAPSVATLDAAIAAMTPSASHPVVKAFDPTSSAAKSARDAYPLAIPVYAAARSDIADKDLRTSYAAFIRYAVGAGQQPGNAEGQLPDGYAPIPTDWVAAATAAADKIAAGTASGDTPPPTSNSNGSNSSQGSGGQTTPDLPQQPDATGNPAPALSSATTVADPEVASGSVVPISLLAGLGAALASAIAGRRKAIRTWIRR